MPYITFRRIAISDLPKENKQTSAATDERPTFLIKPLFGIMPCGWYVLFLQIKTGRRKRFNAKLLIDYGNGFHEGTVVNVALGSGIQVKRIVWFWRPPEALRLLPTDNEDTFEVARLALLRIPEAIGRHYLTKRLKRTQPELQACGHKQILQKFPGSKRQQLRAGYDTFCHSFTPHMEHDGYRNYQNWIRLNEATPADAIAAEIAAFTYRPTISIVIPTWNTDRDLLTKCLDSVVRQHYERWEICLADDASTEAHVRQIVREYQQNDPRIKAVFREQNGHISKASNSALELASGEYVTFLDHDDELAPNALYEVVKLLNEKPDLEIIYSDEDFIDISGDRSSPHFKSDWNPALLLSHNYITHLCVYRTKLVKQVGGLRTSVEGAQDYDLILRCSALVGPKKLAHIPKILYHWRSVEGSTAMSPDQKKYTVDAGRKALEDYFESQQKAAKVIPAEQSNFYRVYYPLVEKPLISLLIPTRDCVEVLRNCITSIIDKTSYDNYEIIIIDNQSIEKSTLNYFHQITSDKRVKVIKYDKPFNYSAINNFAATSCTGEIIGLINNDVEVINTDWLDEMVMLATQPENGCIGAKLYYPDNTIQHAGVIIGLGGYAAHSHRGFRASSAGYFNRLNVRQNLSAVTGACLLVRRKVYEEVGGLDEQLVVAYNDVDFCLRVHAAGYLNVFTPFAQLYHYESKTRGLEDTPEKLERFQNEKDYLRHRWGSALELDPYYNPNLTHNKEDFSLR